MSLLVQTPSPRILTTGNLTTNPPDKEPTHLYVRFQTLNISANPTPAMSPPTTKDDPSSPSESKPAPDMESPATSGSIVPKTITPVDIKVEGGVEEKESAGESGGDGDTREVKVEVDWGKAKASEGRGKAEGKVGEVVTRDPEARRKMTAAGISGVWGRRRSGRRRGGGICLRLCPGGWDGGLTMGREVPSLMVRRSEWSRVWSGGLGIGACLRKGCWRPTRVCGL